MSNPNQHYATAEDMLVVEQRRLVKALMRQLTRTLAILDKIDSQVTLDYIIRLRLEELERAIDYVQTERGWTKQESE